MSVNVIRIDDPRDGRLADYQGVAEPALAERRGVFVAEGRLVVRRLLGSRYATRSLLLTDAALAAMSDVLAGHPAVPVFVVSQATMNAMTGFNMHRGCLAIGERSAPVPWRDVVSQEMAAWRGSTPPEVAARAEGDLDSVVPPPPLLVCLERVANADNVGGVFRSAGAFDAMAVLLDPVSTDPLYRKAIRTSMGAALQVPFARAEPWSGALAELRRLGFVLMAMTPSVAARPLSGAVGAAEGRPIAIVLGHEGEGLTPEALAWCDLHARIPIRHNVDSLNVATAAAIAMYEVRNRRT
jgi:tRNA G18 (ribose-2'-O)-methylase SpoU